MATTSGKLILFNAEFEILYEVEIDDDDMTFKKGAKIDRTIHDAEISWQGDSSMFVINYRINGGRKCLTRDVKNGLRVVKGPARADNQAVFSVSEAPVKTLELPVCFMPNGSYVTGFQRRRQIDNKLNPEIIFWEKNGLRHGEFDLP